MAAEQYKLYKTDEDKATAYDHRLQQAERHNEKWQVKVRKDLARYEAIHQPEQSTADGHEISGSTPFVVGNIDSMFSSMTAVEVDFVVTAKGTATDDQAYVATAALNQEWDHTKATERGNEAIKDGLLTGWGFVKVGYAYAEVEQEVPRERDDIAAEVSRLITEAEAAGEVAPDANTIMSLVPLTEIKTVPLTDRIVVDYVPWDMLLVDPTAKRWGDVKWVAQKQLMLPEEVKNDPSFRQYCASRRQLKKLDDLKADSSIDKDIIGELATPAKDDERVTVYTIFDVETGNVCVKVKNAKWLLNEGVNAFAMEDETEDKLPYVPFIPRLAKSQIRGISEMQVLRGVAEEIDLYHSRLGTYLERMAPRVIAAARVFTEAGKKAMKSQEYGVVVELEEGKSPKDDVVPFNPPALMSEMYNMPEKLEQRGRDATGVSELMRGLFPDRKRTATETSQVVVSSAARQAEKRNQLELFWRNIAKRILKLMQMFYEQERVVRLSDIAGDVPWAWSAEDITFEFGMDISLTPRETKSWQERKDDAITVLNIVGPLAMTPDPTTGAPPVRVTELLRWVLLEMNIPRRVVQMVLALPEEQQRAALGALQTQAAQAQAQAGVPRPDMLPGPMNAQALAASANTGTIPPEILAAAVGASPATPGAAEQVSEQMGVIPPTNLAPGQPRARGR